MRSARDRKTDYIGMDRFTILDGGSATELVRLGYKAIDSDPLWSAKLLHTVPDAILTAHKNFLKAGADIVVTASYQASVPGFVEHLGVSEQEAYQLIVRSVHIARQACEQVEKETGHKGKVAGSVGPYGASLHDGSEYTGNYIETITEQELKDWHRPRIKALCEAGADMVAIETIPCQKEAEVVVRLLETEFLNMSAWVTFSCKNGSQTCHGESFKDAIQSVSQSKSVIAVGLNCTDPQYVTPLLKSIEELQLDKPIIVKPNSGELWKPDTGWYGKETCRDVSAYVPDWVAQGASWIGGCCRVTPHDISNIQLKLNEISR